MLNTNQTENADYRVKINIRNERLLRAIEKKGFPSVRQFCFYVGENYEAINKIIRGAEKPLKDNGELKPLVKTLLKHLDIKMEDAFTERQLEGFKRSAYTLKVGEKELMQIASPRNAELNLIEQDVSSVLNKILTQELKPREEKVVRLRMKDLPFEEIGKAIGNVTGWRANQIFEKALSKLRRNSVAKKLINAGVGDVFTKVDLSNIKLFEDQLKNIIKDYDLSKSLKSKIKNKAIERRELPVVVNHFSLKIKLKRGLENFKSKMLFKVENYYDQFNKDDFLAYTTKIHMKYDYLLKRLSHRTVFKFEKDQHYVCYRSIYNTFKSYIASRSYFKTNEITKIFEDIWIKGAKEYIRKNGQPENKL